MLILPKDGNSMYIKKNSHKIMQNMFYMLDLFRRKFESEF